MSLVKDLIAQFNVVVKTEYTKNYKEFEPKFSELLYEYESGPVETANFPFFGFLKGMEEFTGSRIHNLFPEGYNFTVTNKEWDMSVDIKRKDIDRAAQVGSMKGLNIYRKRIAEMPMVAKDHPIERAFDFLEAGDATTYGTSFDGQAFFSTTHAYATSAGTQNNIVTGGGATTIALLYADLVKVDARFQSFYYYQGQDATETNSKKRKLNKTENRMLVVCPVELHGLFKELQEKADLSAGVTNTMKGKFDLASMHFTDTNDWYAVLVGDTQFRPFLYQKETEVELDMPTLQDENARNNKVLTWGAYGRYNIAYGAWWKAIMVTNT